MRRVQKVASVSATLQPRYDWIMAKTRELEARELNVEEREIGFEDGLTRFGYFVILLVFSHTS